MTDKKESPAVAHMREVSGRADEHLNKLLLARQEIAKLPMVKDKIGAFNNAYLGLESIVQKIEPILLKHGFITQFSDNTSFYSQGDREGTIDPKVAVFKMSVTYAPTGVVFDPQFLTVSLDKNTPQGKKSAYTQAKRLFYTNFCAIPEADDDASATMTISARLDAIQSLCKDISDLEDIGDMAKKSFFILKAKYDKAEKSAKAEGKNNKQSFTGNSANSIFNEDAK